MSGEPDPVLAERYFVQSQAQYSRKLLAKISQRVSPQRAEALRRQIDSLEIVEQGRITVARQRAEASDA